MRHHRLLAFILWAAVAFTSHHLAAAEDWPQWRGANRDGRVAWLPKAMPALPLVWQQPVAGECNAGIALVGERLVLPDHDKQNDYYRCLQTADGKELWKCTFSNGREMDRNAAPRATPLIHNGKVYVLGAFGDLRCLDLKTGDTVWQKDFLKDFGVKKVPTWGFCGSPLIADGKLIVTPGGPVALDPETGRVLWQGKGGNANYSSFLAGRFGGVEQVVGFDAKSLGGWSVETGQRLWRLEIDFTGGYIVPTPVRVGEHLLIADLNNPAQLFAFDDDGQIREPEIAANDAVAPEVSTPVVAGDLLLVQYEAIYCLDLAARLKKLWLIEREAALEPNCHLIIAADRGLAFNAQGVLTVFRFSRTGIRLQGQKKLCGDTLMHPTVSGSRLYVRDSEFVRCYDLSE